MKLKLFGQTIKAVSFDVTGTILVHKYPIMDTYAKCALDTKLCNDPPTSHDFKGAFRMAYKEQLLKHPCFGSDDRQWWKATVKRAVELTGRTTCTPRDFNRFFRKVYQHYGSMDGYEVLPDTLPLLHHLQSNDPTLCLGITTNSPIRSIDSVLPMMGLAKYFSFFTSCQEVGFEKPSANIFNESYKEAKMLLGRQSIELKKCEVLHIGDSLSADFCGAKAFGFSALHLDRSSNSKVSVYQDWLTAPEYEGKSEYDIKKHTITSLDDIHDLLVPGV